MNGDISRATFRPNRHFHDVAMQQGRVHLDADWNEAQAIGSYLDETTRVDTIGPRGVPKVGGGFEIGIAPGATDLTIGAGRIYVDGLLCELDASDVGLTNVEADAVTVERMVVDGRAFAAGEWIEVRGSDDSVAPEIVRVESIDLETRVLHIDPSLANTALTDPRARRVVSYTSQPDLPAPELASEGTLATPPAVTFANGTYLAYLDVWLRSITALDDAELLEPALDGLDTTTRTQTMAQVRIRHLGSEIVTDCTAIDPLPDLLDAGTEPGDRPASTGRLSARAKPVEEQADVCEIPADARYQGLENQLYRVEVHDPGELGSATFKWSRENGSIAVLWTGQTANKLAVGSTGRDAVLGFAADQLVELLDDTLETHGRPGTLVTLAAPPADDELTIDPSSTANRSDFPLNPRIRRWDNPTAGAVTVEQPTGDGYLALEDGVEVRFEAGHYNTGDYWLIPARTATRDVDWPRDSLGRPLSRLPDGIAHHYAPLALVEVAGGVPTIVHDCRAPFPSLTTIAATDVTFDNEACELPGARTVQDALDALCESSTLRRHKKHLHGWGIVCGLRVKCGTDEADDRTSITVRDGYAVDCEGNDLLVERDEPLDLDRLMELNGGRDLFLKDGTGDISLFMKTDVETGIDYGIEPYDPHWDKRRNPLAGDLLNDVYTDCIETIQKFLEAELGLGGATVDHGRVAQRQSIFASLVAQVVNPQASQTIYVAEREHEIMLEFYKGLRELLQSETFCAMFDDATPFPDYPKDLPEMDTIFGMGHHQRIRIRPGGLEAWTVGGGISPISPTSFVNRYDLQAKELLERLAPLAGTTVDETEPDSGAGAISDVAFSPDGGRIYVVAPTKNGKNTLFRSGRVEDRGVSWGELVTICDAQLVTLGVTAADPKNVYASGSGTGIYRIDPDAVDPSMSPAFSFVASGHLVVTPDGRAYATALQANSTSKVPAYDRVLGYDLVSTATPAPAPLDVSLPGPGTDDLAVAFAPPLGKRGAIRRGSDAPRTVYLGVDMGGLKQVLAYDGLTGQPVGGGGSVALPNVDGPIRLVPFATTGALVVVSEDDCDVVLIDLKSNKLIAGAGVPVQVGPVSAAATDERKIAYVLNYWSDTITVIPAEALMGKFPFKILADYRRQIIYAFRDLLAGFLQYLKDCFCDHLLVDCPECDGDGRIYLASVSVRGDRVYKVCNFSRRKYVKSFPTVDYWLSIVPVMPLIQKAVEEFCCMVLPDLFGRYTVPEYQPEADRPAPRFRYSKGRTDLETAQKANIVSKFNDARTRAGVAGRLVADAGRRALAAPVADPAVRIGNLVGRPADHVERSLVDHGMAVLRATEPTSDLSSMLGNLIGFLRTPRAGDEVTLHEEAGKVSFVTAAEPRRWAPTAGDQGTSVDALMRAAEARDAEVAELRAQVQRLQDANAPAADDTRVAALEAELADLRGLRDEVQRLLQANRPETEANTVPTPGPKTAPTAKKGAAPAARTPARRSTGSEPAAPKPRTRRGRPTNPA
ncbi:MAG TPA: DUF6519 domain-containing protein [Verrucomicrobiae bacterium]|nr:DUF6519 domain-containing protein [Verrucomicrobiae bacterium]